MNERAFKLEDYIVVPTMKDESVLDLSKKHFYSVITHEYWHLDEAKINYSTYLIAQENKMSFNKPLLTGNQILELSNVIPELEYYRSMYKVIMKYFFHIDFGMRIKVNGLTFKDYDMFFDYMNTLFTDEALINNTLLDNVVVDISGNVAEDEYFLRHHPDRDNIKANPIKKYQKGMKLTRFFTSLLEFLNKKDKESEKAVGRFRIDPNDKVKIYISAYLPSFIKAGAVGHSCLAEGGVNEHATFMTLGYKNLLVVHDSDFAFRAFLALDHVNKYFTLAHTYPRENFFLQLITYKYLQSLGYKAVRNYFHFPDYMDMGISDHFQVESVSISSGENKDAYNTFAEGIFKFYNNSEAGKETIARTYGCDGCDKSSINPDFLEGEEYCESCRENDEDYGCCASCDDRYHNDDLYYDDENEESYCSSCRDNIEEEREGERRKEEEENSSEEGEGESNVVENEESIDVDTMRAKLSDMNLQVGTNLVRSHDANTFYPTLKLMKHLPNHMTDKDVRLLSLYNSKVSNYREFMIYASLMESAGITWRDNNIASKWNPTKGNTRHPYNMNVMFEESQSSPHLLYNSKDDAPVNELYLRYFYLAKNRLLQIKTLTDQYNMPLFSITVDQLSIADQLQFVSKKYSYADLHSLLSLEKTNRIEFNSNAAYDMFMYMAHSVGFLWSDSVVLHAKVSYMNDQSTTTKKYCEINNKGFISVHYYEGHKPDGIVTITKEILINLSKN